MQVNKGMYLGFYVEQGGAHARSVTSWIEQGGVEHTRRHTQVTIDRGGVNTQVTIDKGGCHEPEFTTHTNKTHGGGAEHQRSRRKDSHSTATAALSNALQHVEWMTTEVCHSMGESGSRPMHTESAAAIHTLAVLSCL